MLKSLHAPRGMVTAPHHLASQAGLAVLRDGGNAVEAMVAMASTIAVVYPHMNAIGGDGFWLVSDPAKGVFGIDACGRSGSAATHVAGRPDLSTALAVTCILLYLLAEPSRGACAVAGNQKMSTPAPRSSPGRCPGGPPRRRRSNEELHGRDL